LHASRVDRASKELLAAIICIGAYFVSDNARSLARAIYSLNLRSLLVVSQARVGPSNMI
jgi:hypothetical protein